MSDLDRFVELYKSVGIELTPEPRRGGGWALDLTAKSHPKLDGYTGFYSEIEFDAEGRFVMQSMWE